MQNVFTFPDGRKFALCYAQTPLGASHRQDTPLRSPQDIDQLMAYLGNARLAGIWRDYYLDQARSKQASPTAPISEMRKRIKDDLWKGRLYFIPRDDPEDKPENIDQAIRTARTSLQMHLRTIIQDEQKEKAALEAEYRKLNIAEKALVSTGAAATGLGKATKDFLIWADNIVDVVDINRRAVRVASAAKKTYWEQNKKTWGQNIAEAEYKELVEALGFDPTKITRAQVNEALELAQLIWDDPETRNLLKLFAVDYAKAQHHTEWTEMAGGLSFEIILTLIIAALTGGAGGVAAVAKNLSLIGRLEKAGQALLTIGKKLKNLKVRAKRKLISVKNSLTSSAPSPKSKHDAVDEVMHKASEKPKSADTRPPITYAQTLAEAKQRLIDAGPAVDKALANKSPLPQSVFSLEDKQKVVADGIKDRYLVRVIESSHVKPEGYIARKQDYGTLSFTAPLSMVEHGDTNAQALLNAFGTRHDPTKNYSILIIDREKMDALGDVQTIIPTFDNLEDLVEKNPALTKVSESTRRQVLKEEFKADYYSFSKGLKGVDQSDDNAMLAAAMSQGHSLEKATLLLDRHKLAKDLSIWEEFTGNGMTLDTNSGATLAKGPFGPVEAVMLDKAPKTLGELQAADAIEIIKAR